MAPVLKPALPFAAVNVRGRPGFVEGLQRHHLIPRAVSRSAALARFLTAIEAYGTLHDFRRNGLMLPARETGAIRMGLPLHRGPHRSYSEMVAERLGAIERAWSLERRASPGFAQVHASNALAQLQQDLRRNLLDARAAPRLNRRDPRVVPDFSHLDAMAERLWGATQPRNGAVSDESAAIAA